MVKGGGVAGGAGNILLGGVIGGIVDGSNGAMKDLTPNPLNLTLEPLPAVAEAPVAKAAEVAPAADADVAPAAEAAPATEVQAAAPGAE